MICTILTSNVKRNKKKRSSVAEWRQSDVCFVCRLVKPFMIIFRHGKTAYSPVAASQLTLLRRGADPIHTNAAKKISSHFSTFPAVYSRDPERKITDCRAFLNWCNFNDHRQTAGEITSINKDQNNETNPRSSFFDANLKNFKNQARRIL